ncbi:MAG: Ppx/GppA family phosphatase [Rhodospirillaceae bacterium]|nr:Ppx/GppA family phosphatase [Rhodospirillaceae bacterium]MYB12053.1 Ppx/GppA family phosphatase [Rhodospirillaceae bacterium]MYI50933.1 Ppx/GppA family phosphatase [Rhodospirillaceae bacterium]
MTSGLAEDAAAQSFAAGNVAVLPVGEAAGPEARAAHDYLGRRVAVIDIGSNSIRLVVFEGSARAPIPIFNEKVMCGLGRGMRASGRLNPEGVVQARANLGRFAGAAAAMKVASLSAFATAAVREAADGPEFIDALRRDPGLEVRVLSGEDEARLSAYGVMAGFPRAEGIVGDLGGGSLELVRVGGEQAHEMATLPLGPLRLNEAMAQGETVGGQVRRALTGIGWLAGAEGKTLYAVGGAWRSLAKVHMAQHDRALRMIDGYRAGAADFADFAKLLARQSERGLERLPAISVRRIEAVRASAIVLRRLIRIARPAQIVFAARGVREGVLYEALDLKARRADPLLAGAAAYGQRFCRFTGLGPALAAWTAGLFPQETPERARLRRAACEIADAGWIDHPDYRNRHAWDRILTAPLMGLDHPGRAFLALTASARYSGGIQEHMEGIARDTGLGEEDIRDARALGQALRLGYTVAAGRPEILAGSRFERTDRGLALQVETHAAHYSGEAAGRRLGDLAATLELEPEPILD